MKTLISPATVLAAGLLFGGGAMAAAPVTAFSGPEHSAADASVTSQAGARDAATIELAQRRRDDHFRHGPPPRRHTPRYERRRHDERFRRRDRRHQYFFEGWWYAIPWWLTPGPDYRGSCDYWDRRCSDSWGYGNPNYRGCMRYYGCW